MPVLTPEQIQADVERATAMVEQTKTEGEKPFTGSSFEQGLTPKTKEVLALTSDAGKTKADEIKAAITPPPTPETPPTPPPTAEETLLKTEAEAAKTEAQKQADKEIEEQKAIFDPIKATLDINKQNQIANIQAQTARLIKAQEEANKRRVQLEQTIGVRTGGVRYTPEHTAALVKEQVDIGLSKIAELNAQANEAISKINNAFSDNQLQIALKEYEGLKAIRKERADKITAIEKTQADGLKKIKEEEKDAKKDFFERVTKPINEIITAAAKNGAPPNIISAISDATTLPEAVNAAGEYIQSIGTGIIGEYNFYKKEAESLGQVPLTFDEYQTKDANRKAKANAAINGVPNAVVTQVDKISASFDSSPIVKQYNEVANKTATINTIVDGGIVGGPSDLALVFEFMKSLDPTSVVRESEYDTASKASNPFKRVAAKMGGYIDKGQILPEEVRQEFKRLSQVKLDIITKQYENLRGEKGRLIEKKTGAYDPTTPGTDYLIDYAVNTGKESIQSEQAAEATVQTIYGQYKEQVDALITAKPDITNQEILQVLGK